MIKIICESCGSKRELMRVINEDGERLELCENCYNFSYHDYEIAEE